MLSRPSPSIRSNRYFWLERWMAILAVLNLVLVGFDLTYLSARSLYLRFIPSLVQIYDPVRGIHPHPETQRYLRQVSDLELQVAQTGLDTLEAKAALAKLRQYSRDLIQNNSFVDDNATVETIQQSLQTRTGTESTFVVFDRFWSLEHLTSENWSEEIEFWNQQIQPLMAANYYRQVNQFGYPIDYFGLIDLPFTIIFAIDWLVRAAGQRQRNPELSWLEAGLRRWYDLFLLLPFWRWLRVIPVTIRLQQTRLVNFRPLQAEARRDFAVGFAKELIEIIGIQIVDLMQNAIRRGDLTQWLLYPDLRQKYVGVNDQNEIKAIMMRMTDITVNQVLPQIQPDLQQFAFYSLRHVLDQLPGYQQTRFIPGINQIRSQTTERLTRAFTDRTCQSLVKIWQDPEMEGVTMQLVESFRVALTSELRKPENTEEIEALLIDLLEEVKINYIKGLTEKDIEQILDEADQIRRLQAQKP
jgi:hypothetical protein